MDATDTPQRLGQIAARRTARKQRPTGASGRTYLQALLLCLLPLAAAVAQDTGSPDAGRELAQRWCSTCHVVSPQQTQGSSMGAPPFSVVADQKDVTPMALRAFLQTSHPRMPNWELSGTETDDVIAYILSMRQHPLR